MTISTETSAFNLEVGDLISSSHCCPLSLWKTVGFLFTNVVVLWRFLCFHVVDEINRLR
eukprot:m.126018 g.126018  ORF g.126018 m.126018 type:complete len:59 (+) comp12988_c3_seq1:676-852(+)